MRRTLLLAACVAMPAAASADDCAPVIDAMVGMAKTPHASTATQVEGGSERTLRMVQTSDARYVERDGGWRRLSAATDEGARVQKALNEAKLSCRQTGSEDVDGVNAALYAVHLENEDTVSDSRLWLGPNGLPLKIESAVADRRTTTVLDYDHVTAPEGAAPPAPN